MVSDSDAIVPIDEQDLDRPETGAHTTPSLSTRQTPEQQIRRWPELDPFWWQDHHRRSQILGPCTEMTRPEALAEMAKLLRPINADAGKVLPRVWTLADWIRDSFLPFS